MSNTDGWEDLSGWEDITPSEEEKKPGVLDELLAGAKGTASVIGDMAMSIPRIGSQALLTTAAKLSHPSYNLDELWKASGEAIGDNMPTMGQATGSDQTLAYKVPMYPFEKYGQGVDFVADKLPNKDVAGAVKMAGSMLPIPFAGKVTRGISKVVENVDPALRNAEYKKPSDLVEHDVNVERPWEQLDLPLENSAQQIAERRAADLGQQDLFGPINEGLQRIPAVSKDQVRPPIPEEAQGSLPFDTSVEDVAAKQHEGLSQRDMFVEDQASKNANDPYREKQAFEQREAVRQEVKKYLDEQKKQQDIETAYKQREEQKQRDFNDEVLAIKNKPLEEIEQKLRIGPRTIKGPGGQRGRINYEDVKSSVDFFKKGFADAADVLNSFKGAFSPTEFNKIKQIIEDKSTKDTIVLMSPDEFHQLSLPRGENYMGSEIANNKRQSVKEGLAGKGLNDVPYLRVDDTGQVTAHEGRHRMDVFKQEGVDLVPVHISGISKEAFPKHLQPETKQFTGKGTPVPFPVKVPRSQRGVLGFNTMAEGFKKLAGLNKNSPETTKAAGELSRDKQKAAVSNIIPGLEPFRPTIDTPEKVLAAAEQPGSKDLSATQKFTASTIKPGIRKVRIASNNPLVNFVGEATSKVFTEAENYSRKYITNKDAIGPLYTKLSDKELVEIHQALISADKYEKVLSPEQLKKAGFSDKQIEFVSKYYEMEKVKLDVWNDKRLTVGLDPVRERIGHFPGIFSGDYKSLVLDEQGKPIGYIGANNKYQYNNIVKQIKEKFPNSTITEMKRSSLGGTSAKTDMFSGVGDLLDVLAKNDERIASILSAVDAANAKSADSLYNANKHALEKKGIWGNEGNKPWQKDSVEAAREAFKGYFRYWEDGMLSHLNMPVEAQIKGLLNNPELDNMPRAKEYVNEYIQHMTGRSVGDVGMALNTLLDAPAKMLGLGPSITRESVNQLNKRLGQQTMGWFNLPFLATQYLQVFQTAMPEFISVANKVGKGQADVLLAGNKSIKTALVLAKEKLSGEKQATDADTRAAIDYAESRGLLTFSEFEDVGKITQGKFSRKYDKIADFNRQLGEQGTRPLVFFHFVELLKDSKLPKNEIFDTAYNLTQDAMVDYSARERPLMFQKLGVAGQLAGGLQTFSFSYLDQMAKWTKNAAKGDLAPLIAGLGVALTYAGIQGLPFYQEADELMKWTTNKFFGEQKSIGEVALSKLPDWARYGGISSSTGLNAQSRLSAADVLPNSVGEAITPYAGQIGNVGSALGEVMSNPDALAARNLAMSVAPSSLRGAMENHLATDEKGTYLNKRNEREYPRTEFDKNARYANMTSLDEYKNRQGLYDNRMKEKADLERKKQITEAIARGVKVKSSFATSTEFAKLRKEYVERKGDPAQLDDIILKAMLDKQQTAKQRAEGIPDGSLSSIYRYRYYNKSSQ